MITGVRFPLDLAAVGFPDVARLGNATVWRGDVAWAWDRGGQTAGPDLPIDVVDRPDADAIAVSGWRIDHLVVLTPSLDTTVTALTAVGADLRRSGEVRGRRAAFLLAGVLLEIVESPVDDVRLWGLALETTEDLVEVAGRWRASGWQIGEPHDAVQSGRQIFSVKGAPLAVMSARP